MYTDQTPKLCHRRTSISMYCRLMDRRTSAIPSTNTKRSGAAKGDPALVPPVLLKAGQAVFPSGRPSSNVSTLNQRASHSRSAGSIEPRGPCQESSSMARANRVRIDNLEVFPVY